MKIRPACCDDTAAMARVRVDAWKVSFRNIVPDWYLDLLSYEVTERQWHKNLWEEKGGQAFVVENELGEVVGTAICGPARDEGDEELLKDYKGEIYVMYMLPTFQRQGAGRVLMHACAHALSESGLTPFFLWTFEDCPARQFYNTLGGIRMAEKEVEYGGKRLMEVCYGWMNYGDILLTPTADISIDRQKTKNPRGS